METEPEKCDMQQQKQPGEPFCPKKEQSNFRPAISEIKVIPKNPSESDKFNKSSGGSGKGLPQSPSVPGEVNVWQKATR
jgi:hypothetical protein